MTNEMVKFTAEVAKGISVGTKDVTIKLLIPLAAVESRLSALAKMQEKEVMVYLGDPQGSFNFEDEDQDPMYRTYEGGRRVTTDASGVVTNIEGTGEPEQDENQAQLFDAEGNPLDQQDDGQAPDKHALEQYILEHRPVVTGIEMDVFTVIQRRSETGETLKQIAEDMDISLGILASQVVKYEFAVKDLMTNANKDVQPDGDLKVSNNDDDEIPDWMKEGGDDQSKSKEMDFTTNNSSGDQSPSDQDPPSGDKQVPAEIDKEQLESYILTQRPIFEDIKLADAPADFPALLQKRNEGKTWMEISKEINVPSSQISNKYGVYKKRVTKMIQDGVAV